MAPSHSAALPVQKRAWNTRERILAAAVACLAEDGYAATTTSRIQERAGVSRGSMLHQFPSRDDLLIAAVQHLALQRTGEIDVPKAAGTIDDAVEQIWLSFHGALFRAALQLWAAAQHNPQLADALRPQEHELGRHIRRLVIALFGPELAAHPGFADLAPVLLSSMRGVALTYTFEPRDHSSDPNLAVWKRLAHRILDAPAQG
ncbi:TetR/AcrR family transcriptional regulator [Streptomyces sp. NBC_01016]|uniref:TetR/AcrR family transcriptional regulator n=1 Tax=Streptomyces sp. NBC_01016 TaxID=2903720 RepID=UPI00225B85C5|nr:TetR/AcrR family transcriptional regulator [Streptomyces sp. NBC_01016]MCX4834376.1 TetR/AcrR family transcriptional regulator [Streptomyces sp. NBC_01016]